MLPPRGYTALVKPQPSVRGRVWRSGQPQDDFEFALWVDLYDPDHDQLAKLASELSFNHWAVEDAGAASERVKATVCPSYTFFTVYAVQVLNSAGQEE